MCAFGWGDVAGKYGEGILGKVKILGEGVFVLFSERFGWCKHEHFGVGSLGESLRGKENSNSCFAHAGGEDNEGVFECCSG